MTARKKPNAEKRIFYKQLDFACALGYCVALVVQLAVETEIMTLLDNVDALRLELLLLFLCGTYAVAALSSSLDYAGMRGRRYATYKKPSFAPPPWLFGVAWSILYTVQGIAAYLVRVSRPEPYAPASEDGTRRALILYAFLQLLLALYAPFAANLGVAFFIVLSSAALAVVVTVQFFSHSTAAGWLMTALVAWLLFASLLSFSLLLMNSAKRLRQIASDQSTSDVLRSERQRRLSAPDKQQTGGYSASFTSGSATSTGRKKKKSSHNPSKTN